ncbi:MAG TPA: hypothetical protein VKR32_09225 [Puia sp.]|nr:hypothetical protein [Puia sp.]
MKTTLLPLSITSIFLFPSCGPNVDQKAAAEEVKIDSIVAATQKAIEDSVKNATEDSINIANGMATLLQGRTLVQDAIPFIASKIGASNTDKTNADAQMINVESFHFLRSVQDKQMQIANEARVQQNINNRVDALQTILKIFRRASDEMEGLEDKRFKSYADFEHFSNNLSRRIDKMKRELMDESNSNDLIGKFDFDKTLFNADFIAEVGEFKRTHAVSQ